jgi:hypothetical protein
MQNNSPGVEYENIRLPFFLSKNFIAGLLPAPFLYKKRKLQKQKASGKYSSRFFY